ncbi:antibiotic biosynthesis monooxygenase [Methylobacterium sp. Leaf99]|uniref:antibiotic biosynthesis monooxygenase family protein n=1 Tax=unclassified Methylobacterium TaxID=2615210 RepID=UPI0006FFC0F6|nr:MULTISPECIES: antibiotic biosynthesis monooxygenase family protein [unclassified Methylobacterium]KQP09629.1 antibiotic biosynthesis monooxygenase [Methylobacterium sp. Leaf99]TXM78672.1 antibiotic biosynthesis monooxygenase [Methylobacterium sp. WL69]
MILEIAQIDIKPGSESDFEAGIAKASEIFRAAKGCRSFAVRRSIEKPQRYRLLIEWDTLEAHTKDFTGSQPWQDYRAMVSPFFEAPPSVEHTELALKAF